MRFKLDAQATWTPGLVEEVAAAGAVETIDFKGHYGFEVAVPDALAALYDHVLAAFPPTVCLDDPHDLPAVAERLAGHLERVSYDAPIRSAEDVGATPPDARVVNVRPSRVGTLRRLREVYSRCEREGRPMYGGGMGELGVGRGLSLGAVLVGPSRRMREISLRLPPRTAPRAPCLGAMGRMGRLLVTLCLLVGIAAGAASASAAVKRGTGGRDRIVGTAHADRLSGKGGRDVLLGRGGRDILIGDSGGDRLYGGRGRDTLLGGSGNDLLVGGPGRDVISCGAGRDTVVRGPGDRVASDCERVRSA